MLIEFDHQRPANLRHLAKDPQQPIRDHIHVVVRTPNGNDYGKDLLRQIYQFGIDHDLRERFMFVGSAWAW